MEFPCSPELSCEILLKRGPIIVGEDAVVSGDGEEKSTKNVKGSRACEILDPGQLIVIYEDVSAGNRRRRRRRCRKMCFWRK